ncbi:hypothetical protein [Streptomyces sp. NPDC017529]|uniref:hypothetical protein n=1 Tax=Streptomyces sp. NPDC017529 TaxID=3365000 RepID=UPI00379766F3
MEGLLAVAPIDVGVKPKRDSERQANQAALDRLAEGISATVDADQRGADYDGTARWSVALHGDYNNPNTNKSLPGDIAPGWAPLEIGNTDASSVLLHLARFGSVARWPYGQDILTVLHTHPRGLIQGWRLGDPAPDSVMDDLAEFSNWVATGRMLGPKMMRELMRGGK